MDLAEAAATSEAVCELMLALFCQLTCAAGEENAVPLLAGEVEADTATAASASAAMARMDLIMGLVSKSLIAHGLLVVQRIPMSLYYIYLIFYVYFTHIHGP